MSDLTNMEKRKFERLLEMGSGYVLNFSNRTIEGFILDSTGRAIYDSRYDYGSGSKANRLRAFWNVEPNPVVGKLMGDILDYGIEENTFAKDNPLLTDCRKVAARLMQDVPVAELDALTTSPRSVWIACILLSLNTYVRSARSMASPSRGIRPCIACLVSM